MNFLNFVDISICQPLVGYKAILQRWNEFGKYAVPLMVLRAEGFQWLVLPVIKDYFLILKEKENGTLLLPQFYILWRISLLALYLELIN